MSDPRALPPWPERLPAHGRVVLRQVGDDDLAMARSLATDPYVPLIGSLPADADDAAARDWIERNRARWAEGRGFSFAVVEVAGGRPVGHIGLHLAELAHGRASAGYSIVPAERGHGYAADALTALTAFAWTIPDLYRIELHIEPWNVASLRTAERAGYQREGLLRSYLEIGGRRRDMLVHAVARYSS